MGAFLTATPMLPATDLGSVAREETVPRKSANSSNLAWSEGLRMFNISGDRSSTTLGGGGGMKKLLKVVKGCALDAARPATQRLDRFLGTADTPFV